MGKHASRRVETVTRSGATFNVSGAAVRKGATSATVLTATAAVTASLAFGQGQAQAAIPQVTEAFAGIHTEATRLTDQLVDALGIESGSYLGGVALGPNYLIDQVTGLMVSVLEPILGDLIGEEELGALVDSVLAALGIEFGHELAIAILPGTAIAIPLGEGTSATAISILGAAVATDGVDALIDKVLGTTLSDIVDIPGLPDVVVDFLQLLIEISEFNPSVDDLLPDQITDNLPGDIVFCLGALALANSGSAGSCLNVAATLDARYNKKNGEVQLGLTNPLSALTYLTDPGQLMPVIGNALTGQPIYLLKDFVRLSLNGPEFLGLTSSYGFETVPNGAPVTASWLGSSVGLFPGITQPWGTGGWLASSPEFVNYLSLPSFDLGFASPQGLTDLIPSLGFSAFNVLDMFTIGAWNTSNLLNGGFPTIEQGPFLQILGAAIDLIGGAGSLFNFDANELMSAQVASAGDSSPNRVFAELEDTDDPFEDDVADVIGLDDGINLDNDGAADGKRDSFVPPSTDFSAGEEGDIDESIVTSTTPSDVDAETSTPEPAVVG